MKSVLSVDVAKGKSMIMLSTEYGEVLIEPKEIKHNFRDFNELKDKIHHVLTKLQHTHKNYNLKQHLDKVIVQETDKKNEVKNPKQKQPKKKMEKPIP